jgi:hypothetical protein
MAINYSLTLLNLSKLVTSWTSKSEEDFHKALKEITTFFEKCKQEGITRKQSYDLIQDVLKNELNDFQETVLWDFETSITGHIDENCIQKFPNEIFETNGELVAYVRSKIWLE